MGVLKNKKVLKKNEPENWKNIPKKYDFASGESRVNIRPDYVLKNEKGEQLYIYKAFNISEDKGLPLGLREFIITSKMPIEKQEIKHSLGMTAYHKKNGFAGLPQILTDLKHQGWMDANSLQFRNDRQKSAIEKYKLKAEKRKELREAGLLDKKGHHPELLNY